MIVIEDKSQAESEELWAQDINIPEYKVVEDRYVAYKLEITTVGGAHLDLWRRYVDFTTLRYDLENEQAREFQSIPELPPKSANRNLDNQLFLNERRDGLEYFLKCTFLNPQISRSQAIRKFIRS